MKWIKRLFLAVFVVGVLVIGAGGVGYYMYHSKPTWYRPRTLTAQQRSEAHDQGDKAFLQLVSWAGSIQARRKRESHGTATAGAPIEPITVNFTEDALNSFISEYPHPDDSLAQFVSPYLGDPRVVLLDNQVIIAGDVKELGTLSSAHFDTGKDEKGQMIFRLAGIYAGRLPVPQSMLSDRMNKVTSRLNSTLASEQRAADIDSTGLANLSTSAVAMSRLFLNALNGDTSDPVLFLPCYLGNWHELVPVTVDDVAASEGSLKLTLSPMSAAQEAELLKKIKSPPDKVSN